MKDQDGLIGTVLQNRYRVVKVIGEVGMGLAYEGTYLAVKRRVAIKCLHSDLARDPDIVRRFQREARAAVYTGNECVVEVLGMDVPPKGGKGRDKFGSLFIRSWIDLNLPEPPHTPIIDKPRQCVRTRA